MTILFYALVDNYSPAICLPLSSTLQFLTDHNLDKVLMTNEGTFRHFNTFCDTLELLYTQVAESSIHSEEEGSVLYFVGNHNTDQECVLALCKLKTLEYRVFRKLREKLRNFVDACKNGQGNTNVDQKLKGFIQETNDLCEGYKLPHGIEVY